VTSSGWAWALSIGMRAIVPGRGAGSRSLLSAANPRKPLPAMLVLWARWPIIAPRATEQPSGACLAPARNKVAIEQELIRRGERHDQAGTRVTMG
jgi:hypothetical protein